MCHAVPAVSSVVTTIIWHRTHDPKIGRLNSLFYGATIFGVVDHAWNGELFMFSGNLTRDLMLGVAISAAVVGVWALSLIFDGIKASRAVQKSPAVAFSAR